MSGKIKIWLVAAASLILCGCIIFGGVMVMLKWDFKKLSTVKYETNTHFIDKEFTNISMKTNTADIKFIASQDGKAKIVCHEEQNAKYSVLVKGGVLTVELVNSKKWYEHIGINFGTPKITVYLPNENYGNLSVKESTGDVEIAKDFKFESIDVSASTGDVTNLASVTGGINIKTNTGKIAVKDISAHSLELSVSTGKVTVLNAMIEEDVQVGVSTGKTNITNAKCKNLTSGGDTGDITLKDVVALEKISMERSTGDVEFERSDAAEISVSTDTGDVSGSLLTDKIFVVSTDTGRVEVPKTTSGGTCEITTDTGDIKFNIVS